MDAPRLIALIAGAVLALFGSLIIVMLLIAGLWEGFARARYTLGFIAFSIYVLTTAGLSFYYAARKPNGLGWVLTFLYVPAIAALIWMQRSQAMSKRDQAVAESFVDPAQAADAVTVTGPLVQIVETEEDYPAMEKLIRTLQTSDDLSVRLRIVSLFGGSSPANGHAHSALRNLYSEMAEKGSQAGPEELRIAVRDAILTISPADSLLVDELDRWREERSR